MRKKSLLAITLLLGLLCFGNCYSLERRILRLSLSDCLDRALANNLDIKIARVEAMAAGQDVLIKEAVFDTLISGRVSCEDDRRASPSVFTGEKSLLNTYEVGIEKTLISGTRIGVDYSDARSWTDNAEFVKGNPLHTAELSFTLKQPVLKNIFGFIDRKNVKVARIGAEIADIKALDRIENAVAAVEKAYWRLVFAHQNAVLRKNLLSQAENLHNIFKAHLKTGFAEETDVYETEANVRIRAAELAVAENDLLNASNNLKLLLNEKGNVLILPEDRLVLRDGKADLFKSLDEAFMANREYRAKKKELESKKVKLQIKQQGLWPEIDLVGTFALNGLDRKFEKANRTLTTDKYPYYYAGVEFSVPLENTSARGEYKKASLEREKAVLELARIERRLFTSIDENVRNVNMRLENARRWRKIREIQQAKFKEEESKLKYGRSSSKTLIDYQSDLTLAGINEYKAIMQYYIALVELEDAKDTLLEKVGLVER